MFHYSYWIGDAMTRSRQYSTGAQKQILLMEPWLMTGGKDSQKVVCEA